MPERGFRFPIIADVGKPSRAAYYREYYQRKRKGDAAYQASQRVRSAAWRADPANQERIKEHRVTRRADPDHRAADRKTNREAMQARRDDPAYRDRERGRARARYQAKKGAVGV